MLTRKAVVGNRYKPTTDVNCHAIVIAYNCREMHDVESRPRRRKNLRAQAEAFMPASSNHLTVVFLAKILRIKTCYDFRFLATMPWNYR